MEYLSSRPVWTTIDPVTERERVEWVEQGPPLPLAVEVETGGLEFEANNEFQGSQSYSQSNKTKPKNKKIGVIKSESFAQQTIQG